MARLVTGFLAVSLILGPAGGAPGGGRHITPGGEDLRAAAADGGTARGGGAARVEGGDPGRRPPRRGGLRRAGSGGRGELAVGSARGRRDRQLPLPGGGAGPDRHGAIAADFDGRTSPPPAAQ